MSGFFPKLAARGLERRLVRKVAAFGDFPALSRNAIAVLTDQKNGAVIETGDDPDRRRRRSRPWQVRELRRVDHRLVGPHERQIGSTKRGDRYVDCRIGTGFAFDRSFLLGYRRPQVVIRGISAKIHIRTGLGGRYAARRKFQLQRYSATGDECADPRYCPSA